MKKLLTLFAALFVFSAYCQETQPIGHNERLWAFDSACLFNMPVILPTPQDPSVVPLTDMEGAIAYNRTNKVLQYYTGLYWLDVVPVKGITTNPVSGLSSTSTPTGSYTLSCLDATPTQTGTTKLYNAAGQNYDGSMNQAAITNYVNNRSLVNSATTAPTNTDLFTAYPNGTYGSGTVVAYPYISTGPMVYIKVSTTQWLAFSATLF